MGWHWVWSGKTTAATRRTSPTRRPDLWRSQSEEPRASLQPGGFRNNHRSGEVERLRLGSGNTHLS